MGMRLFLEKMGLRWHFELARKEKAFFDDVDLERKTLLGAIFIFKTTRVKVTKLLYFHRDIKYDDRPLSISCVRSGRYIWGQKMRSRKKRLITCHGRLYSSVKINWILHNQQEWLSDTQRNNAHVTKKQFCHLTTCPHVIKIHFH